MQIGTAAIGFDQGPILLGVNVQRSGTVIAETDDVGEGAHNRLEPGEIGAISRCDVERGPGWLAGFEGAIENEGVRQAIEGCRQAVRLFYEGFGARVGPD